MGDTNPSSACPAYKASHSPRLRSVKSSTPGLLLLKYYPISVSLVHRCCCCCSAVTATIFIVVASCCHLLQAATYFTRYRLSTSTRYPFVTEEGLYRLKGLFFEEWPTVGQTVLLHGICAMATARLDFVRTSRCATAFFLSAFRCLHEWPDGYLVAHPISKLICYSIGWLLTCLEIKLSHFFYA